MPAKKPTLAEITQLLTSSDLPPETINMLRNDSRVTVTRLLKKWQDKQQNLAQEISRVQKLYQYENSLSQEGLHLIAGIDEAGRGPLAGPVVAAAVILPIGCHLPYLNDSKKLSAKQRDELYDVIKKMAIAASYTVIEVDKIDQLNIYQATVAGMYESVAKLNPQPDAVLIDAVPLSALSIRSIPIVGGDAVSASIAAASIIAKVERDRIMLELDNLFPQYGFARHKGYGTQDHMNALQKYGPCPAHRRSFEPVRLLVGEGGNRNEY